MNRDDVIRMAREAGFEIDCCSLEWYNRIERFAALVAAAEREACAKVCEAGIHNATDWDSSYWDQGVQQCAIAIRARSRND